MCNIPPGYLDKSHATDRLVYCSSPRISGRLRGCQKDIMELFSLIKILQFGSVEKEVNFAQYQFGLCLVISLVSQH